MYTILIRKLYQQAKTLVYALDQAWLMIQVATFKSQDSALNQLALIADHLQSQALALWDNFAEQETSDRTRLYSAVQSNLTLISCLMHLANHLDTQKLLSDQSQLLQKAAQEAKKSLFSLIDESRNEFLATQTSVINHSQFSRLSFLHYNPIAAQFPQPTVEALTKEVSSQIQAERNDMPALITYWKREVDAAIQAWEPPLPPKISPIENHSGSHSSSLSQQHTNPIHSNTTELKSVSTASHPDSQKTSPANEPTPHNLHHKVKTLTEAQTESHALLQNKAQVTEQIIRLLPSNLELDEKQEASLLEKIKACLSIQYKRSRFVTKALPHLHLDESALLQTIKQFQPESTHYKSAF
jgi:hypothetical protein